MLAASYMEMRIIKKRRTIAQRDCYLAFFIFFITLLQTFIALHVFHYLLQIYKMSSKGLI